MIDYSDFLARAGDDALQQWFATLPEAVQKKFDPQQDKNLQRWLAALASLPRLQTNEYDLAGDIIRIGGAGELDRETQTAIEKTLRALHPWRKGPFAVFGIHIDTEWRSDWKWQRLAQHIHPLAGRTVLDVGCGSGYHTLRMAGAGAALALGIEPMLLYCCQFAALRRFLPPVPAAVLPFALEEVPDGLKAFDTVFSMGVLYHRRSPIDHLYKLRDCLRPGGELVLETLVIEGKRGEVLVPKGRYAKMRNVWFIPSCAELENWLQRCGFRDIRLIDRTQTTTGEQRRTEWMHFESLADFLDPNDPSRTIEGLPAPVRALFLAQAPG
ncbi:MAG TPA: tRNA 5-methoxyuridine(34)/uridine 5-oxyacetic acid(34) synthase CmoB [Bacteroidetes bacterium]|nr:tRNA 5-methoxyuridine(34)/uridine 5-oxyacetic acid(34) synthase CmoB [Bacteroidota bacterium]